MTLSTPVVFSVPWSPATHLQAAQPAETAGPIQPGPLTLDDRPEPLDPKQPRTEAEADHLEALTLFAAGRTHEHRKEYREALRLYQRALRRDPQAVAVARSILPLAYRLERHAEAVRYALRLVELEEANPLLLQQLGRELRKAGDFNQAVTLYEKAVAAHHGAKQTALDVGLRMEMGHLYFLIEEYGKAADCFAWVRHALDHPEEFGLDDKIKKRLLADPGLTYSLFGECFLQAGRVDEAVAAFEKARQVAPNTGLLEFNLARVHLRKGKPDSALVSLETYFKEHLASEGMAPYELLAEVLEDLGKNNELIERLEKLQADDPDNIPLGYFLAGRYGEAKQFEKAERLYLALIKKTPTLTGYRGLVEIYRKTQQPAALLAILGEAAEKTGALGTFGPEAPAISGDADLMRSLVETAREKYKAEAKQLNYGMRFALALLALESKQFETAAEFFDLALKLKPDQAAELLLVWGTGLLLEERPAEAVKVFRRAVDGNVLPADKPVFHYYLAGALAMDGQTDEALAAARKAVEMARAAAREADREALAAEEALFAAKGQAARALAAEKAAVAARKAVNKKDDWARFSSRVGWVSYHAKRHDEAAKAYRELIEKFDADHKSNQTREVLREARLILSNLCVLKDDLTEAEEWLEQVLDEFPDDVGASNDLGYLWADQGKHLQRALRMIRHAVDAEPDNVAYRDSLGWVFYRLGRYEEAVAELEKAAAGDDEPDPIILDHLGDAYAGVNQPQKAKAAWRQAAKTFQRQEEPQKATQVEKKINSISHVP